MSVVDGVIKRLSSDTAMTPSIDAQYSQYVGDVGFQGIDFAMHDR